MQKTVIGLLQVTKKHFKDLAYVRGSNEISLQELIVYTDSESDKDLLMVRHIAWYDLLKLLTYRYSITSCFVILIKM